jgi:hypothetical protein
MPHLLSCLPGKKITGHIRPVSLLAPQGYPLQVEGYLCNEKVKLPSIIPGSSLPFTATPYNFVRTVIL